MQYPMQYPRLVYKSVTEYLPVEDEEQHADALKAGWFDSVPEANAKKAATEGVVEAGPDAGPDAELESRPRGRPRGRPPAASYLA